ncbi:MAG: icmP [Gammaproteobacteria bacterium]|jgi:intracellular multiplication protein IcmP|nr:icmP [Gammaproteobacteria bacterium]
MQGKQGSPPQDSGLGFLWVIFLSIAAVLLIWHFGRVYITQFVFQLKLYEIRGLLYVFDYWNHWMNQWHIPLLMVDTNNLQAWGTKVITNSIARDYDTMTRIAEDVGRFVRYPLALLIAALAAYVASKNIGAKFTHVFNMKTIKMLEKDNWPQITPVLKNDLVKEDIDKGPWAMAMTPIQFCKKYNLLKEKMGKDGKPAQEVIPGAARQVFVMQLGPLWTDPNTLPMHAKALFGAFAACGNEDRASAFKLLHQIDISAGTGKLNFEGAEKLFAKHMNSKLVLRVLKKHAYVLTVFASMFNLARTDGVFAASEFLWLKPIDRKLWYMLNNVGRRTAFAEVAGPYAHWLAEKKWGAPLRSPMLDEAVKALAIAVSEVLYEPEED